MLIAPRLSVLIGAGLSALASRSDAQFPRLAPPPPCRVQGSTVQVPLDGAFSGARIGAPKIAIMPFQHAIERGEQLYLPWAIENRLGRELAKNSRIAVISPGSVGRSLREGGNWDSSAVLLHADYTLRGEVTLREGVRSVTLVLRRSKRPLPVWRASFGATTTLRAIVNSTAAGISRAVGSPMAEALNPDDRRLSEAAYEELAKGDFVRLALSLPALDSARVHYERARALSPSSPRAIASLARVNADLLEYGAQVRGRQGSRGFERVLAQAAQALSADSTFADTWTVMAVLARLRDPVKFGGALAAHQRAVTLAPTDAAAHHEYGVTLLRLGDDRAAELHFRRALDLEPNRAATLAALAEVALRGQRWGDVCAYANASIGAWAYDPRPYASRARARLRLAQARDAYADAETAARLATGAWIQALRVIVERGAANDEVARRQARQLAEMWLRPDYQLAVRDATHLAMAFMAVDDRRRAIESIRRARPLGADLITAVRDPAFNAIRSDTAVVRILRESATSGNGR